MQVESFSDMPIWSVFAEAVIKVAACPDGSLSNVLIDWPNKALR
jgi:hypothetical protein